MAEVLTVPIASESHSYYSSPSLKRSSTSYSSFLSNSSHTYTAQWAANPTSDPSHRYSIDSSSRVAISSQPTSLPNTISHTGDNTNFISLPSSSLGSPTFDSTSSLDEDSTDLEDDELSFPSYDGGVRFIHQKESLGLLSPTEEHDCQLGSGLRCDTSAGPTPSVSTADSTISESPLRTPLMIDDTAVKIQPSRHVDYLSHDWCEEDIWASWRHIVSRRNVYGQRSRLENASWRTWAKSKYQLATIPPEALNWLKESDVTWLYGPLAPSNSRPSTATPFSPTVPSSEKQSTPHTVKKPILKKRSMSEVMLQRSLSASSLVKQAAATVQAQQFGRRSGHCTPVTQHPSSDTPSQSSTHHIGREELDYFSRRDDLNTSDATPQEDSIKRHIRFDDKVGQCIAVECKDSGFEDDHISVSTDSESDSEEVVMWQRPARRQDSIASSVDSVCTPTSRSIEKLPDTTLKGKDSPKSDQHDSASSSVRSWFPSKLFHSPSQETLRPADPNRNFLLSEDAIDDEEEGVPIDSSSAFSNRRDSVAVSKFRAESKRAMDDDEEHMSNGMRRTPSGMFMPYEEDEDDIMAEQLGLLSRVSDTINTAKDIAHVIWNVGWRK